MHAAFAQTKSRAFLVAPPDSRAATFPASLSGFRGAPEAALPFPSVLVASANDPYASIGHAGVLARQWGSELIEAGSLGHINADSGIGDWPEGHATLRAFVQRLDDAAR